MTPNEIMHAAIDEGWMGMDELILAAMSHKGREDWTRAFAKCEDCGNLIIDPAVFDCDGKWVEVQIGHGCFDRDGLPTGLPPIKLCCEECAESDENRTEAAALAREDNDESYRRYCQSERRRG